MAFARQKIHSTGTRCRSMRLEDDAAFRGIRFTPGRLEARKIALVALNLSLESKHRAFRAAS